MAQVLTHTGFKKADGTWFIGAVNLVIDTGNNATPVWPKNFHNAWGKDWEMFSANPGKTKLFYKEIPKQIEIENKEKDQNDQDEYVGQLEAFCGNQDDMIKRQTSVIAEMMKDVAKLREQVKTLSKE